MEKPQRRGGRMDKSAPTVYKQCIAHHYWHHMDDPKCFFEIMVGDFRNGMTIPKKFVANLRDKISEQVTLEVPNGKTYTVEVAEEQQKELVLRSGWAEFASASELELDDLLVFTKSGNSHLKVRIFDRSGCEKELSCVPLDSITCMNKSDHTIYKECIAHHYWLHMDDPKCFFKVMIGDLKNGLTIPKKFVSNIREKISEQVTLEVPDGKTYTVEVAEEQQKELVLRSGWAEFASAYEIELGDLVVFTNSGNSHLTVRIFERSGCEKELSCVLLDSIPCMQERKGFQARQMQPPTGKRLAVGSPSGSRKTPKMNPMDSPSHKKRHVSSTKKHGVAKLSYMFPRHKSLSDERRSKVEERVGAIHSKTRKMNPTDCPSQKKTEHVPEGIHQEPINSGSSRKLIKSWTVLPTGCSMTSVQKAKVIALEQNIQPKVPFYITAMHKKTLDSGILAIPKEYVMEHLIKENGTIQLCQLDGSKVWTINLDIKTDGDYVVSTGWMDFIHDNKLGEGDICVFEPAKSKNRVKLIFRTLEESSCLRPPGFSAGHVSPTKRHGVAKPSYMLPQRKSLTDEQRSKVEETVGAIQSGIPVYVAVMTNTSVNSTLGMAFGSEYAREYLPSESKNQLTMRLQRKNDAWEPDFRVRNGSHLIFGKGWREFVSDNRLERDDICLFSLRKNIKTLTMEVYIIRK